MADTELHTAICSAVMLMNSEIQVDGNQEAHDILRQALVDYADREGETVTPPVCRHCGYDPSKWVTIGTIKVDIETETETFTRATPDTQTSEASHDLDVSKGGQASQSKSSEYVAGVKDAAAVIMRERDRARDPKIRVACVFLQSEVLALTPTARPVQEAPKSLSSYLMAACTEVECRLCQTPLHARTPEMRHAGIAGPVEEAKQALAELKSLFPHLKQKSKGKIQKIILLFILVFSAVTIHN